MTVDELLNDWTLVRGGIGNPVDHKACAASLLSIAAGESFSDTLECAHPILNKWLIAANDHETSTEADQEALVRHGETGVLDTWWIPTETVLEAWATTADHEGSVAARTCDVFDLITLWKDNKTRAYLYGADLYGAYLYGADLRGADLRYADLRGADLRYADLYGADLRYANLGDANLRYANLRDANLRDAKNITMPDGWRLDDAGRGERVAEAS